MTQYEEGDGVVVEDGDANGGPVEATGKTVDEAVESALAELGLERHEVSIEVLAQGRAGLFGIGGEQARVRVARASHDLPEGDEIVWAKQTLEHLLELMHVEAEVTVRPPETPGDGAGRAKAVFDIEGDDLGVLIGRRGTTMTSLQYMLNLMVSRKFVDAGPYHVDVEGYRRRREEWLRELAFRMAERVRTTGRPIMLEPMPANERRLIHLALAEDPTVGTSSVGEGESRKVAISVRR
jgi:spoIIIJ-associated protein